MKFLSYQVRPIITRVWVYAVYTRVDDQIRQHVYACVKRRVGNLINARLRGWSEEEICSVYTELTQLFNEKRKVHDSV